MSYLWILVFIVALVGFVFYRGIVNEKKRKLKKFKAVLSLVGKNPQASLRCGRGGNYNAKNDGTYIDDITWENLDLENVYNRMNYCLTSQGADYLYEILHRPISDTGKIDALEEAISLADKDKEELIRLLCDYSNEPANRIDASKVKKSGGNPVKESLLNIGYVIAAGLISVNAVVGVVFLLVMVSYMILTYFPKKSRAAYSLIQVGQIINIYYTARSLSGFRQLEKTNEVFSGYEDIDTGDLSQSRQLMKQVVRYAYWFGGSTGTGSGIDTLLVYIKMLFHIDLVILYKLETHMEEYVTASYVPGRFIGFVDASLSIAMWRCSLGGWTRPEFVTTDNKQIVITDAVHPLLDKPIPASIEVGEKGVLLTGSNASGKSTFLKNMALQLVLAQTVNTVTAKGVKLPLCHVISAMGVKDNLLQGDSYYMAEIKAIKRVYDQNRNAGNRQVVCFLDEILRGTNTKERIAGSAAILKDMQGNGFIVFCATHDRELTYILENDFDNYHFSESIVDGDICFNYELNIGRANSSNAISLLKNIGFNDEIISEANKLLLI